MLTAKMLQALNEQIQKELSSAYLYLSMSAHFEGENLRGMAHWMRLQWQEEIAHAMKLFDYVHERGGQVVLEALPQPKSSFGSPLKVFEETLKHEQKVTASIHQLYELAQQQKDYATAAMLQWFITEQVEEESTATTLVEQLRMIGDQKHLVLAIDRELARRE